MKVCAPWVIDGPITRLAFDRYVETQLAPTLAKGDVVILDNLAVHKSAKAAQLLKSKGAWFLFLPP
ncbi:transposase, partial [Microvirga massiliensis]|uniref:transposase n=1 Tax=Microvirga massiliensis TaxID=1033741 RepID=UPI000B2CA4DA